MKIGDLTKVYSVFTGIIIEATKTSALVCYFNNETLKWGQRWFSYSRLEVINESR
jgi:hypothetical protein